MSSHQQKPLLSCARVSRLTTLFATPACVVATWLLCRALVALGIWVSSSRDRWDSILLRSDADPRRRSLRKMWALTSTSIVPAGMPQRCCSVWAGPERFWQQEPVVMPWGTLWPVLHNGASWY